MGQACGDADLSQEALRLVAPEAGPQDLDGDLPGVLEVFGEVDRRRAAAADLLFDDDSGRRWRRAGDRRCRDISLTEPSPPAANSACIVTGRLARPSPPGRRRRRTGARTAPRGSRSVSTTRPAPRSSIMPERAAAEGGEPDAEDRADVAVAAAPHDPVRPGHGGLVEHRVHQPALDHGRRRPTPPARTPSSCVHGRIGACLVAAARSDRTRCPTSGRAASRAEQPSSTAPTAASGRRTPRASPSTPSAPRRARLRRAAPPAPPGIPSAVMVRSISSIGTPSASEQARLVQIRRENPVHPEPRDDRPPR